MLVHNKLFMLKMGNIVYLVFTLHSLQILPTQVLRAGSEYGFGDLSVAGSGLVGEQMTILHNMLPF
jgi:hypothetical protein